MGEADYQTTGSYEQLVKVADESVYAAKKAGKSCVRTVQ
jgi:GGDEF domain-containing protein